MNYNDIVTQKQRMSKFKEPNFLQALIIFALIIITLDIVEDWILYLIENPELIALN